MPRKHTRSLSIPTSISVCISLALCIYTSPSLSLPRMRCVRTCYRSAAVEIKIERDRKSECRGDALFAGGQSRRDRPVLTEGFPQVRLRGRHRDTVCRGRRGPEARTTPSGAEALGEGPGLKGLWRGRRIEMRKLSMNNVKRLISKQVLFKRYILLKYLIVML